jgi:CheY-like chemotaxis protein
VPAAPDSVAKAGRETILLVEDEQAVRRVVGALLRRFGYNVIEAASAREASGVFEQHAGQIDLLVTDVVMPEMDGPALAKHLIARHPDLRVLFMSGYTDLPPSSLDFNSSHVDFLSKPIQGAVLAAKLRELLAS